MIKVYTLQNTKQLLTVKFTRRGVMEFARRYFQHHCCEELKVSVWFLGERMETFTLNKEKVYAV